MIRVKVLVAGLILGLMGVAEAGQSMSVVYQQLIENKMQLLADSQDLVAAENNQHIDSKLSGLFAIS